MENITNGLSSLEDGRGEDTYNCTQLKTIFEFLKTTTATASRATDATGVPQKNICRYKRDLEKSGRLWETEKKPCKHTGFKAWYLTTNPEKAPFNNQLNLF